MFRRFRCIAITLPKKKSTTSRLPCNLKQRLCSFSATGLKLNLDIVFTRSGRRWKGKCMFHALLPDFMWLETEASIRVKQKKGTGNWFIIAHDDDTRRGKLQKEVFAKISFTKKARNEAEKFFSVWKNLCPPHHRTMLLRLYLTSKQNIE